MRIPPIPTYDRQLGDLEKHYKQALKEVTQLLVKVDPKDTIRHDYYSSIIRQLTFIINELNKNSREWIETTLTEAMEDSVASSLVTMGLANSLVEAKGLTEFSLIGRNRVEAMIADTFTDILKANSKMEETMKDKVRELQAGVLKQNTALQRGTVTSARDLREAFIKEGFSKSLVEENWKGIVDAGGKRWDLTTYTQMVSRTKLQQVQLEGAKQTALHNDTDLAIISSHGAKDACRHFEGMIVSLTGRTKGFPTLADVRGSNLIFHPNCQHSVHTIGDYDALPQAVKNKAVSAGKSAEKAMANSKEILKQDNARRYQEKKARVESTKQSKRSAIEKARAKRKIERTKGSMTTEPSKVTKFDPDNTKLKKEFLKDLYEGTPIIDLANEMYGKEPEAIEAMFGKKMTMEGLGKAFNPDPSKYNIVFSKSQFLSASSGTHYAELDMRLNDLNGNRLATINRTIVKKADGSINVKNSYLEFAKESQGAGFATNIYYKSEQLYKEMAKGKPINISLQANLDVGVYAWARHGFDFKDADYVLHMRRDVEQRISHNIEKRFQAGEFGIPNKTLSKEEWNILKPKLFQEAVNKMGYNSLDELNHSWQFSALDDGQKYEIHTNQTEGHLGKHVMLRQLSWDGVKKLNQNHDSEIIGNLYFESKGVE